VSQAIAKAAFTADFARYRRSASLWLLLLSAPVAALSFCTNCLAVHPGIGHFSRRRESNEPHKEHQHEIW
jgi:hypothetical protein